MLSPRLFSFYDYIICLFRGQQQKYVSNRGINIVFYFLFRGKHNKSCKLLKRTQYNRKIGGKKAVIGKLISSELKSELKAV